MELVPTLISTGWASGVNAWGTVYVNHSDVERWILTGGAGHDNFLGGALEPARGARAVDVGDGAAAEDRAGAVLAGLRDVLDEIEEREVHFGPRLRVAEELADVFVYALLLLDTYDLDLEEIVQKKLEVNEKNYPVEIARGNADKHH